MKDAIMASRSHHYEAPDAVGLMTLFFRRVELYPNRTAVITAERSISYAYLAEQATLLATHLMALGVKTESPVAILLPSGIEHIVCQVAVLLAGGSCVPLNISAPDERLNFMLREAGVSFTLTDGPGAKRGLLTDFINVESYPRGDSGAEPLPGLKSGPNHRGYVMFTSGTTGHPKAVEVETRGIIRLVVDTTYQPFTPEDRMGSISSPDFDAILWEVWGALLNGGAVVIIRKEVLLDPEQLKAAFVRFKVSAILVTPSLFNFITTLCPGAFKSLTHLMIGGEAFNMEALRNFPSREWPENMYNVYGPTENTTYTLYYPITAADLNNESMPLGQPIDKTEAFILNDQLQLADIDELGELYVGGEGVARGYLNRRELTDEKFILIAIANDPRPRRVYKTGDLGWVREDGAIMYAGRADNQIKLQGYRIEAEEVEAQLLRSGLLLSAVVCAIKQVGDEGYLVAFVVPRYPDRFNDRLLFNELKQRLPPYMLPRIVTVDSIPLNANDKADRAALLALYKRRRAAGTA